MQIKRNKAIATGLICSIFFLPFCLFLLGVVSGELSPKDSSAIGSATATINVNIPDNISIELSKDQLSIDLGIEGDTDIFGSDNTVVDVSTNNYTGYKLYLTDNDDSPVGNTALIRQKSDPSDTVEASIPTIEDDGTYTSATMVPSHWGWSVTTSTTGYKAIAPKGASTAALVNKDIAVNHDYTPVYFGVKAYSSLPGGVYKSSVVFTAVANYQPDGGNRIKSVSPNIVAVSESGNREIAIDTDINYVTNLVDEDHPLTVTLINSADNTDTVTCANPAITNNSGKVRIICTTPAAGLTDGADYTVKIDFAKLHGMVYRLENAVKIGNF